ncbi:MAG: translation initiation factor IF-3, partial [Oscillospiraceae bacterium]|nr:translation initiation factor IF-3 [Oscillospiraceae bacterium]
MFVWRCLTIASQTHLINEEIQVPEVRLISESGEQLGIMSAEAALAAAEEQEMDLVMISP